ncbi:protease [Planomonospora parontospora subsp. parontospora]|uniref:Protease n=2 Tax=Planomonospora parontospora TaxID=58119 RepID=A0AA37BE82_9ACTN|nr:trypsin-like peptidase domain-containing protein [Planomonospora parontospora]GGK57887.1 protease [Planomonospora parontospora]GII07824.1 protease [Planomonospora parontospora subsp. parontospora]
MERLAHLALLTAVAVTLGGCSADIGARPAGSPASPAATASPVSPAAPEGGPAALEAAYEKVIGDVLPSIVQINTRTGLGSGVVYDTAGHIVTNAHVIGQAREFEVTLASGGAPRPARLVEAFELGDLAVIKVDDPTGLTPAKFGDSGRLRVGQIVLAMGNPLGLSGSVTNGIVSALGRTVSEPQTQGSPGATITNAIQTSAAINPGNSGGALVNLAGEVIGIPTLAATNPELGGGAAPGIGFAIPSNTVTDIAGQIIKGGKVVNTRRAALGVSVQTVVGGQGGAVGVGVMRVTEGGGAERAGIEPGDVIVSVNGTETPTTQALSEVLATLKPGDEAKVGLLRPDGSTPTVTVTLGELSED